MLEPITISVIIPIYQVEAYLQTCVSSVCGQSYRNLEILLVDDGATDGSPALCDRLSRMDHRIKVVHKQNGGLSDARNAGIKAATGDYVLFLDGDDFWKEDTAVEKLVARVRMTAADVINFSYIKYYEETQEEVPYFIDLPDMPVMRSKKEEQCDFLTGNWLYIASACNKLIRKALLTDDMLFRKGVYSEDIDWSLRLLIKAESLDFICENFYCYRQRKNSITHTIDAKKCLDLCENIILGFALCRAADAEILPYLYRYLAYQYGTFFKVQTQTAVFMENAIQALAPYQWVLRYHCDNRKLRMIRALCTVLGVKGACKFLRCMFGRKQRKSDAPTNHFYTNF